LLRIAIVGLGPWGVCALERIVTTARRGLRAGLEVEIHVIEPGTPGSGVYDPTQPDYLLLNSTCAAIALHPFADQADLPSYCISLYDWADAQGYRWVGDFCSLDPSGRRIEPGDYLPRLRSALSIIRRAPSTWSRWSKGTRRCTWPTAACCWSTTWS
jgi:hypothetical protein